MTFSHSEVNVAADGDTTIVAPHGDIDIASSTGLAAALEQAVSRHPSAIVVTLRAVTFLDSTGLSALVRAWRAAVAAGIDFHVRDPSERVRRVFDVTGLESLLMD